MSEKLDIGGVLRRAFETYREQAGTLLPAAFIIFLIAGVINAILIATVFATRSPGLLILGGLILLVVAFLAGALFAGMVVELVQDVQDGRRDFSIGDLFRSAAPAVPSILGAAIVIALAIYIVPIAVFTALGIPVLGFLITLVLLVVLGTMWAVAIPAIVIERPGIIAALKRSRELTSGSFWQVLAVLIVVGIIVVIVAAIFNAIGAAFGSRVAAQLVGVIANTLVAPIFSLAVATMYFRLRQLREGVGAAPGAVGPAPTGAAAPGGVGGGSTAPSEPTAPPQAPPPGTTPGGPSSPGPAQPPPPAEGSSGPPGPDVPPRPRAG
jgi:Membrane domain of glycerophosphoryl diester phosphodiesterase